MSTPHSSVNYVEPNISAVKNGYENVMDEYGNSVLKSVDWTPEGDDFNRSPRLEDYSMMVNLEVEVCPRINIAQGEKTAKDVLIMSFKTANNGSASTVNFMGGTKINCNDSNNTSINYLTTNYANMYVGDLINYGTTEMIGIKSIDIEYQKSCVPNIKIKFTDVRGLSLFQPTELSRSNAYQGIGGINADNVSQSFFQCFFRVPMPKFTITIKGFYGRPVTYEVMCDKFETSFNSDTGDFDIDTRFIGYSYSFLTDIVMDALLAAPYSDYGGLDNDYNTYWAREINSGRFTIWNKEHTKKDNIPTLYEVYRNVNSILSDTTELNSVIDEEEETHEQEIAKLTDLKDKYTLWYTTLFNVLCNIFGKEYCYLFTDKGCHYRILVLTTIKNASSGNRIDTLNDVYEKFPDDFKEIHKSLISAIDEYNKDTKSFKTIKNISIDFSDYRLERLFKKLFINAKNEIVFNGFDKDNVLPETDVFRTVIGGANNDSDKNKALSAIYNDGVDQYIYCYAINEDYSNINSRIQSLQTDANRPQEEKRNERRRKALNKVLFERLNFYPSVENFSRMMMAHLETLMNQMYDCVNKCSGRKASKLGVGMDNLDIGMKSDKDPEIPPFPRIYRDIDGDDGITKREDAWVGDFKGSIIFEEENFINGLFNGSEKVMSMFKDLNENEKEKYRQTTSDSSLESPIIKYPLSSFDFSIKQPPYGESSDVSNDDTGLGLMGRIAIRMFDILAINNFRQEFGSGFWGLKNPELVGKIEADNFFESTKLVNDKIRTMIRNGIFEPKNIISSITSSSIDNAPWGKNALFSNSSGNLWLDGFKVDGVNSIYPVQNINYNNLLEAVSIVKQNKMPENNGCELSLYNVPDSIDNILSKTDDCGYGTTLILDDISNVESQLSNANNGSDNDYTWIYKQIASACSFDNCTEYASFANVKGTPSIALKVNADRIEYAEASEDGGMTVYDSNSSKEEEYYKTDISMVSQEFMNSSRSGNFSNVIITEIFGSKLVNGSSSQYTLNESGSLTRDHLDEVGNTSGKSNFPLSKFGGIDGVKISDREKRMMQGLFGIKLNYSVIGSYVSKNNTILYLPKLVALQIGSIVYITGGVHSKVKSLKKVAERYIPVNNWPDNMFEYIASLSKVAKYKYEKFFIDWIRKNGERYLSKLVGKNSRVVTYIKGSKDSSQRTLLNQNSNFVKEMTNELLKAVCIVKLCVNHHRVSRTNFKLNSGDAEKYLGGFMERLKQHYKIDYSEDENGNLIKTTDEPHKTTTDMKKELYRYLKQIYDKWIPMSSRSEWNLEAFFNEKGSNGKGHKFYFIDSFYNDISNKLIINPKIVADKIRTLLDSTDINVMLLGFMADMYSANKSMLMVLQNFADLRKKDAMNELFTPMPYNAVNWGDINKDPSFVVVYPYQASRNLNIPNSDYKDDGFMLNDEYETPKAIRSKKNEEDGHFKIPAFGVTYGGQYQSYFKKVNIDMKSPIATEQSIRAKHALLRASASKKEKTIVSQDLYDIYATQSYTCSVEMMGCPWIQPLMYFVLLNVPMFRGSYMIMKVRHTIKPGNMITTFTGCRMANISNPIIEDIFTDGDIDIANTSYNEFDNEKQLKANVDNDCPYKIFPLWGSDNVEISKDEFENAHNAMQILMEKYNFTKEAAAGMCGNIFKESTWRLHALNGIGAFGLCQWLGERKALLIKKYGNAPSFNQQMEYIDYEWDNESVAKSHRNELMKQKTPEDAAFIVRKYFERPGKSEADDTTRQRKAKEYYDAYSSNLHQNTSAPSNKDLNDNQDVNDALFEAIKKSAQATPSISVELEKGKVNKYYVITQKDKKADKLGIVFDMILNSEYYNYVQKLYWVYSTNGLNGDPAHIDYIAADSPEQTEKTVRVAESGKIVATEKNAIPEDSSEKLLRSLAKYRAKVGDKNITKDVPQIKDLAILDKYKPKDCDSLFSTNGGNSSSPGDNSSWTKAVQSMGKWYESNVHEYNQSGWSSCDLLSGTRVRHDCSGYVSACLQYFGTLKKGVVFSSCEYTTSSKVSDLLKSGGFTKLNYSWDIAQPYDIISYCGHVEILAEKGEHPKSWGWGSCHDCRNGHACMPAGTGQKPKGSTYKVIWRYMS